jgi:hypothetical protein
MRLYTISICISDILLTFQRRLTSLCGVSTTLKHKIRPDNACFKAKDFDVILSAPKEALHQLLIGLYGEHLLPATMYDIEKTLRNPNTIKGFDKNGVPIYITSKQRLKSVFFRLRNRLSSLDSSTSTIEVTTEYASHFYDMYIRQHDGKHMTGDRMRYSCCICRSLCGTYFVLR